MYYSQFFRIGFKNKINKWRNNMKENKIRTEEKRIIENVKETILQNIADEIEYKTSGDYNVSDLLEIKQEMLNGDEKLFEVEEEFIKEMVLEYLEEDLDDEYEDDTIEEYWEQNIMFQNIILELSRVEELLIEDFFKKEIDKLNNDANAELKRVNASTIVDYIEKRFPNSEIVLEKYSYWSYLPFLKMENGCKKPLFEENYNKMLHSSYVVSYTEMPLYDALQLLK